MIDIGVADIFSTVTTAGLAEQLRALATDDRRWCSGCRALWLADVDRVLDVWLQRTTGG